MDTKKLTVGVTSYNVESYIAQALDSILAQKTNFSFDILVVDDASTDKTQQILEVYQRKYPETVKVIYSPQNYGNLHTLNTIFAAIKTPYFLLIDGDDYLLDSHCLQKEADFLDAHPDFTLCGGNTVRMRNGKLADRVIPSFKTRLVYTIEDYFNETCPYVHTSALMVRNVVYNDGVPEEYIKGETTSDTLVYRGDTMRFLHHLQRGKLFIFPNTFSVYRIRLGSIWQGASDCSRLLKLTFFNLRCTALFPEQKGFFTRLFFWNYQKLLKCLGRSCYQKDGLSGTDRKIFYELLDLIACYDLDGRGFRRATSVVYKCWIKAKAYGRILMRQVQRIAKSKSGY